MTRKAWAYVLAGAIMISGLLFWLYLEKTKLPYLDTFPKLDLETVEGESYSFKQPSGNVRLIELMYTRCPDICPENTTKMKILQDRLKEQGLFGDRVTFMMITFDPTYDTKDVMTTYANKMGLDRDGWVMVSDTKDKTKQLTDSLGYIVQQNGDYYNHTTKTYLVDANNVIRAEYGMANGFDIDRAYQDIMKLVR